MTRLMRWLAVGGLVGLLVGCALLPATPTLEEASLIEALPTWTATPRLIPSMTPPPPCPPRADVAVPPRPDEFPSAYVGALRDYLSAGGAAETLPQLLADWEASPIDGQAVGTGDFTGDGAAETVVAFINPLAEHYPPEAVLAIYGCEGGAVRRLYTSTPPPETSLYLIGVQDLTRDAVADVAFAEVVCSAVTCWHTAHVWSWAGTDVEERLAGALSLPHADFTLGDAKIAAATYGLGSVDAGPQRPYTETWAWQGTAITYTGEVVGPPRYRYQAFRAGDEALYAGDYDTAFDAYLRVLRDEDLAPWAVAVDAPAERRWLEALAQWRLLSLGMQLGNFPDAEARYQTLQEDWAPGDPGYPVALMANRFWEGYLETGNVAYGCLDAVNASATGDVLAFLNSFGYANPVYTAEELCPFLTP
jgi:hypothetical protein